MRLCETTGEFGPGSLKRKSVRGQDDMRSNVDDAEFDRRASDRRCKGDWLESISHDHARGSQRVTHAGHFDPFEELEIGRHLAARILRIKSEAGPQRHCISVPTRPKRSVSSSTDAPIRQARTIQVARASERSQNGTRDSQGQNRRYLIHRGMLAWPGSLVHF